MSASMEFQLIIRMSFYLLSMGCAFLAFFKRGDDFLKLLAFNLLFLIAAQTMVIK